MTRLERGLYLYQAGEVPRDEQVGDLSPLSHATYLVTTQEIAGNPHLYFSIPMCLLIPAYEGSSIGAWYDSVQGTLLQVGT
jgi:hypothetical protein